MAIYYCEKNKQRAQELRRNLTRQEKHLWFDFLQSYSVQFRRQKQIGPYIVDFYCSRAKLIIELDGSQHYEEEVNAYDRERDEYLKSQKLMVLRVPNNEIDNDFAGVCEEIDSLVKGRM